MKPKVKIQMEPETANMKVYKFQHEKWIEAEQLHQKNIAVVVNQKENLIYFWQGKKANPRSLELAKKNLLEKKTQYGHYKYRQNIKEFPQQIQNEITKRIEKRNSEK